MTFSTGGFGFILASLFDEEMPQRLGDFPWSTPRGQTLLIAGDMGGAHAGQLFETYSFIVADIDRNQRWLAAQGQFRAEVLRERRRMAFKALNDRVRKNALAPFLRMGTQIVGCLITFAISRSNFSAFRAEERSEEIVQALSAWKPAVRERLMRLLHLSAFLVSGLSAPGQDVLWIVDEDAVAAKVDQLKKLTRLFGIVVANSLSHDLRHIRCGTAESDDGSLALEDLLSYSDLAAGAVAEFATAMGDNLHFPQENVVAPFPPNLSWKSRNLTMWLGSQTGALRRLTCLIKLSRKKTNVRAAILHFHAQPGLILTGPFERTPSARDFM